MSKIRQIIRSVCKAVISLILCCAAAAATLLLIIYVIPTSVPENVPLENTPDIFIMDALDSYMDHALSEAEAGARSVRKHFWLNEDALAGPAPNPDCYGQAADPKELQWLLEDAAEGLE